MTIVAVTGANGLIGQRIIQQLVSHNLSINALTRNQHNTTPNIKYFIGDITNADLLKKFLYDADILFHCAGEIRNYALMNDVNVLATVNLAKYAKSMGVSCFVHMSSSGVIGPSSLPIIDESTPCLPGNPYEKSKWQAEQELIKILEQTNIRLYILRPTIVIDSIMPGVVGSLLNADWKSRISLFIKGGERAHIIHAIDVATIAIKLALSDNYSSGIYFVGCDEDPRNTISGIFKLINKQLDRKSNFDDFYLPVSISHAIRTIRLGPSLHGNVIFSSKKLLDTGLKLPLGLDGAIDSICNSYPYCQAK